MREALDRRLHVLILTFMYNYLSFCYHGNWPAFFPKRLSVHLSLEKDNQLALFLALLNTFGDDLLQQAQCPIMLALQKVLI